MITFFVHVDGKASKKENQSIKINEKSVHDAILKGTGVEEPREMSIYFLRSLDISHLQISAQQVTSTSKAAEKGLQQSALQMQKLSEGSSEISSKVNVAAASSDQASPKQSLLPQYILGPACTTCQLL